MNIVRMRKIAESWGITYQGFIYLDNNGIWMFRYYGQDNGWQLGPLSEFCPA